MVLRLVPYLIDLNFLSQINFVFSQLGIRKMIQIVFNLLKKRIARRMYSQWLCYVTFQKKTITLQFIVLIKMKISRTMRNFQEDIIEGIQKLMDTIFLASREDMQEDQIWVTCKEADMVEAKSKRINMIKKHIIMERIDLDPFEISCHSEGRRS